MKLCTKNFDLSSWFLSKRKEFCGIITTAGAKFSEVSNCIKLQRIISLQIPYKIKQVELKNDYTIIKMIVYF